MTKRLVSSTDVIGQMARFAVTQHPFNSPPELEDVVGTIKTYARETFKDGVETLPMQWFEDSWGILNWLKEALNPVDRILKKWNTPQNNHKSKYVFTSRYDSIKPEYDFIDIDALLGNVARCTWNEAEEYEEKAA